MARKLANISDWSKLDAAKPIVLPGGPQSRKVRLEVMCGQPTRFDLMLPGEGFFPLGVVDGYEVLEFWQEGDVCVSVSDAKYVDADVDAWMFTADGQKTHFDLPDAVTFTRIAERRARNHDLELMQYVAQQNIEKRFAALAAEQDRKLRALGIDPETGEVIERERAPAGAGDTSPATGGDANGEESATGGGDDAEASGTGDSAGDGTSERLASNGRQAVSGKNRMA